jgi:hypothetical protein
MEHIWASGYTMKKNPPFMKDQLMDFYVSKNQLPFLYG